MRAGLERGHDARAARARGSRRRRPRRAPRRSVVRSTTVPRTEPITSHPLARSARRAARATGGSTRARARRPRRAASGSRARLSSRVTIICTAALSARPSPVTASFTSLGLYCTTGTPARAAATSASPLACPTDIAVRAFDLEQHPLDRDRRRAGSRRPAPRARRRARADARAADRRAGCGSRRSRARASRLPLADDDAVAAARETGVDARAPGPRGRTQDRTRGSMLRGSAGRRPRRISDRGRAAGARARTARSAPMPIGHEALGGRRARPRRAGRPARPPATRSGAGRSADGARRSADASPTCRSPATTAGSRAPARTGRRRAPVSPPPADDSTSRSRFSTNWPSSFADTSASTPRPNCATLPVIERSVTTSTLVPPPSSRHRDDDRRLGVALPARVAPGRVDDDPAVRPRRPRRASRCPCTAR